MNKRKDSPNMGAAAVIGLTAGVMSIYFISQCPSSEPPRRGYPVQSQSSQTTIRLESSSVELPYNTKHNVNGLELEYLKRDYGAEARIRYDITNGRIDTGLKLRPGVSASLPINDSDMQVRITMHSSDEQKLRVTVNIAGRSND